MAMMILGEPVWHLVGQLLPVLAPTLIAGSVLVSLVGFAFEEGQPWN